MIGGNCSEERGQHSMADIQKITLVHTNDIHSHFERMSQITTVIKQARKSAAVQENVIVIDLGDHMDRMAMETEATLGEANVAVMNEAGYDLAVLGNNEGLTVPPDLLGKVYERHARFPVLCANLKELTTENVSSWMKPYSVIRRGRLNIGFIAVTAYYPIFYRLLGWEAEDPFLLVRRWTEELRSRVDVLVVLSHIGINGDKKMAEDIPGIDVILGAHTHHLLEEPLMIGESAVCAAGRFGEHVGLVDIEYDLSGNRIASISGRCVRTELYEEDGATKSLIRRYSEESRAKLAETVACLTNPLPVSWTEESPFGNLLASGIRRWVEADIGVVNAGQLLQSLLPGPVTKEVLLGACPSPINPCLMTLRGEDLWTALEESLLPEYIDKPMYGFGFRGKRLGVLCIDGMSVEYDPAAPPYRKIRRIAVGDDPFDPLREYRVGSIDMFTFSAGYLTLAKGTDIRYFLPEFLRDVLTVELARPEAADESRSEARWIPVPGQG